MKFYNNSLVTITTTVDGDGAEFFGYEPEVSYRVRSLGRGRWQVTESNGRHRWVLRTAELQRTFKSQHWVEEYDFDGEPVHGHQSVRVERDPWWRW